MSTLTYPKTFYRVWGDKFTIEDNGIIIYPWGEEENYTIENGAIAAVNKWYDDNSETGDYWKNSFQIVNQICRYYVIKGNSNGYNWDTHNDLKGKTFDDIIDSNISIDSMYLHSNGSISFDYNATDENATYTKINSNEINVTVFKDVNIVWSYKDGNWSANSPFDNIKTFIKKSGYQLLNIVKPGDGFWIYAQKNEYFDVNGSKYNVTDDINISKLTPGWHLLGTGENISVSKLINLNKNIKLIWKYTEGKWYGYSNDETINEIIKSKYNTFNDINESEGFWVYVDKNTTDKNITTINEALNYLNYLRNETGMVSLNINNILSIVALNHSIYMKTNNIFSHYENEAYSDFIGTAPADRAVYAGYLSRYILENISYGDNDYKSSIDGLFSAIYHRFGFLNPTINEIGIGKQGKFYTYDMGNSNINNLCGGEDFKGYGLYYTDICSDENKKIDVLNFNEGIETVEKLNPKIIIWPPKDSNNIPPAFFEEIPDPLSDYSVSGYPVSVIFNKYYFKTPPKLVSFQLFDENGEITNTRLIDKETDPNNEFNEYSYALFPLNRLDWNRKYKVKVVYDVNNTEKTIEWNFTTKKLPYSYYKINTTVTNLKVISGKTYAFYFVPQNGDDTLGAIQCSFSANIILKDGYIDENTAYMKLTGDKNGYAECDSSNGNKLKLTISDN